MSTSHPEFKDEQAFLRHAYSVLQRLRAKTLPNPGAGADPKAAAALRAMQESSQGRLWDDRSICFGRIDCENGGPQYYVGPNLIWEAPGIDDPLVISWAAEQATPFYTATPEAPAGLRLRRRFRTSREKLRGIQDERFGVEVEAEPTISDFLLDELGQNRTGEMRQIAATIQADQYRIIARAADRATIVQGGPGTGKTVVGLHRAALLLYRQRDAATSSGILIVGPNRLFMQYIQSVLPSLGETSADQRAVTELGPIRPRIKDELFVARVKGDVRMVEFLRRGVVDRVRLRSADPIKFEHLGIEFEVSAENVAQLIETFDPATESYAAARTRFIGRFHNLVADAYAATAPALRDGPAAINPGQLPEVQRARDRIWPTFTAPEMLRQLLSSEDRIDRAGEGAGLTALERRSLWKKPVERIDDVIWTTSDVALADEIEYLLDGRSQRYWHVVLDEAQDLTPMELRMIGRRIRDGGATILGDLAQATGVVRYSDWHEIVDHLGLPEHDLEELTWAYRVPRAIMDIALPVLDLTAPAIKAPVAFREGAAPEWHEVEKADVTKDVARRVAENHRDGGTVAIIGPPGLLPTLRVDLEAAGVAFGDAERDELATTTELLDASTAKGLEFDHVYLVEPNMIMRQGQEDRRFQELYVALTRATRTLTCVYSEPLGWPLSAAVRSDR